MQNRIVAVCHEIGSARAVVPVIQQLIRDGFSVHSLASHDNAAVAFREAGIAFKQIESPIALDDASVLLSGTSDTDNVERELIDSAKSRNIPVVSVLDNWMNYAARFSGPAGPLQYAPDILCVMNAIAKDDVQRECRFEATRIEVAGQPNLDKVAATTVNREDCRKALEVRREHRVVVFASQPLAGCAEAGVLKRIAKVLKPSDFLLVRPHPQEYESRAEELEKALRKSNIRGRVRPLGDKGTDVIGAADVVIGMTSLFLLEAVLLERKAISFTEEPFIGTSVGIVTRATNDLELRTALEATNDERSSAARARKELNVDGGSAKRIAGLVAKSAQRTTAANAV